MVRAVAEAAGLDVARLEMLDDHPRSEFEDWLAELLVGAEFTERKYVRRLRRVLSEIVGMGSAVLVGHGARMVAPADCFSVRRPGLRRLRSSPGLGRSRLSTLRPGRRARRDAVPSAHADAYIASCEEAKSAAVAAEDYGKAKDWKFAILKLTDYGGARAERRRRGRGGLRDAGGGRGGAQGRERRERPPPRRSFRARHLLRRLRARPDRRGGERVA